MGGGVGEVIRVVGESRWFKVAGVVLLVAIALAAPLIVPRTLMPLLPFRKAVEFVAFGAIVGAYGTMVGAGGGFLIVPAMLLVYHATPAQAAGTSLVVVFFNAASGSFSYARQRRVDYHGGALFAVATLPGAVVGAYLARLFSGRDFDIIFGVLLLIMASLLIWRPTAEEEFHTSLVEGGGAGGWWVLEQSITDRSGAVFQYTYNRFWGVVLSFFVGFASSVLGIGGGIIHVPALIHLLNFPAHVATATSHFILTISSAAGAGAHYTLGHVLLGPALLMGAGAVVGAQGGARIARRLHGSLVIRLLSLALIVVGLRLLFR